MRFFADTAWHPTALLPSQGVRWEAVNDRSAYATLTEGDISITMLFTFNKTTDRATFKSALGDLTSESAYLHAVS